MKRILLCIALITSFTATAKMTDCDIAKEAFRDSGSLLSDVVIFGSSKDRTPESYDYYHAWYKNYYPKKLKEIKSRYDAYQQSDSNNPIYLGLISIIEANNFAKAMDKYLEDANSNNELLKASTDNYKAMYKQLVKDCGKIQ
ncbi:hypothetical protein AB7293_14500 [Providencia huaxiensis]|uniref:hypothetical protein n=1 Tax=Providencia huaxiensis TaxID=2027290 RepID=UPI0034E4009E